MIRRSVLDERGAVLPLVLLAVMLLSALAFTLATLTTSSRQAQERHLGADRAAYVARAGLERACAEILLGATDWTGLAPGPVYAAEPFDDGVYDVDLLSRSATGATLEVRAQVAASLRTLRFELVRDAAAAPPAWIHVQRVDDLGMLAMVP